MFELLLAGIGNVLHLKYLVPLVLGTLAGLIGGALPGVTITMTIIVVLPFTFGLDPLQGLAAMTGVYVGGSAGGAITAALIGIPAVLGSILGTRLQKSIDPAPLQLGFAVLTACVGIKLAIF